jgi:hypothetical protein
MISRLRLAFLAGLFAAQFPLFAAGAPADYPIQLVRKSVVGERYVVTIHATQEQSIDQNVNGRSMAPQGSLVLSDLVAAGEVLALTPLGKEMKSKLVVEKFTRTEAGQPRVVLPPGTELIAERKDKRTEYFLDGKPVTAELAAALAMVSVEQGSDQGGNDDVIFGSQERKRPGDAWPINAAAAVADIAEMGVAVEPGNMTGNTTLVEVVKTGNQEALRLQGALTIKNVKVPLPPLPPGIAVRASDMVMTYTGLFPTDVTKRANQSGLSMVAKVVCGGTMNGAELIVTFTMRQSKEIVFSGK